MELCVVWSSGKRDETVTPSLRGAVWMSEFYIAASGDLSDLMAGLTWNLQCSGRSLQLLAL